MDYFPDDIQEFLAEVAKEELERAKKHPCGTCIHRQIDNSVKNYHEGLPVRDGVVVDEVEMTVYDDWELTATIYKEDENDIDIYAPLTAVKGEEPLRLWFPEDIEGFTPIRGHEYHIKVRRFYWYNDRIMYHYELLKVLEDKSS